MKKFLFLSLLAAASLRAEVKTGLDVLAEDQFRPFAGKKVGLIVNRTSVDKKGVNAVDLFRNAPGVTVAAVFSPEHGFSAREEHGSKVADSVYPGTFIPLYSLYGDVTRPTPEMLKGVDVLVFDIQDVGARFYTYITTLGYAEEEAARNKIPFVVLDRPNPLGGEIVEGEVLAETVRHFTAYYSIPTRHGMTVGEIAKWHNGRSGPAADLTVVPMKGWRRSMLWEDTGLAFRAPSPNIATPKSAFLYPGIGAFESTNVAVGRGTNAPFRVFGAPWVDGNRLAKALNDLHLPGVSFRPMRFKPVKDLYKGKACRGVRVFVSDPRTARPVDVFVHAACWLRDDFPKDFQPRWAEMPRVVGSADFESLYKLNVPAEAILERIHKSAADFLSVRKPFLLYE